MRILCTAYAIVLTFQINVIGGGPTLSVAGLWEGTAFLNQEYYPCSLSLYDGTGTFSCSTLAANSKPVHELRATAQKLSFFLALTTEYHFEGVVVQDSIIGELKTLPPSPIIAIPIKLVRVKHRYTSQAAAQPVLFLSVPPDGVGLSALVLRPALRDVPSGLELSIPNASRCGKARQRHASMPIHLRPPEHIIRLANPLLAAVPASCPIPGAAAWGPNLLFLYNKI